VPSPETTHCLGPGSDDWVAIVDDDPLIRRSLSRAFGAFDIQVESFSSAESFLDHASRSEPSCIVLDIQLGGLSGFDLQDVLESRGTVPPPIVFISAHTAMLEHGSRIRRAHGFLHKPFDIDELVALIRPLLRSVPLPVEG
jgi:FixJ family two-component response regulator